MFYKLPTGETELYVTEIEVLGPAGELPMPVFGDQEYPEDIRLKYRFLDLRRDKLHRNIMRRGEIIDAMRRRMKDSGFSEFQTPILTASSPEGARDFLVPSRLHAGKFYALPQAPQQYKQLLMMAGFDRYFQIAPCFRDEDPRYTAAAHKALEAAAQAGCVLEVNTSSVYRGFREDYFPSPAILKEWLTMGGNVTITADAHEAKALTFGFEEAAAQLKELGYTRVLVLGKDGFAPCEL